MAFLADIPTAQRVAVVQFVVIAVCVTACVIAKAPGFDYKALAALALYAAKSPFFPVVPTSKAPAPVLLEQITVTTPPPSPPGSS